MKVFLIAIFLLSLIGLTHADVRRIVAGLTDVTIEPPHRMRGKAFKWDQELQIALPASYGKTQRAYPVLWVTDGPMYFELAVKTVNYDLRHHLPEMIVVAVGPPPEEMAEFAYRRNYEFTPTEEWGFKGLGGELMEKQLTQLRVSEPGLKGGGAASYLAFLVDEARTGLSKKYRIADDHVLFGDSGGGNFCVYALLARPSAFSRYICGSPSLHEGNYELFKMEERYAKTHSDLKATAFFGAGEAEMLQNDMVAATGVVSSMARMAEILRLRNYPSLALNARIFPGEDHASVPPLNLSWGLRAVWESDPIAVSSLPKTPSSLPRQ